MPTVHTLDLHFQNVPGTIAAYLLPHPAGAVLVECGPGSTVDALTHALDAHDLHMEDVTDVLVTHIHLDHAGAAGHLARHGATVHVHHVGAPHLIDPSKLLSSAERIYGDAMDRLWGMTHPVPADQIHELHDGDVVEIGPLSFTALDTPGHAYHHMAYLHEGICFTGDVGGVRMQGTRHVMLPLPPPEIDLDRWRGSLATLRGAAIDQLAPTHFGPFEDVSWHLDALERALDRTEAWTQSTMADPPPDALFATHVTAWQRDLARADGVDAATWDRYETANPSWMAAAGLKRWWKKHGSAKA
jgi:glyoxylase-like metal-dependent hydrolase (beta-lactamase superfamily II)